MRTIIKIPVMILVGITGLFVLILCFFHLIRLNDLRQQKHHLASLKRFYETESFEPIDEQSLTAFDLEDASLRFNEIQMVASHNSYKKKITKLGQLFVGVGDSFDVARSLDYAYPSLTEQFNMGIRSIELDVRYRQGAYEVVHVPLVDASSQATDLALALEEIALWSTHHPHHIPIIVLLEMKDDWMMLDPFLEHPDNAALRMLDAMVVDQFGEQLYTPADLQGTHNNLKDAVGSEGWPLLQTLLGKVMFVLHPGPYTNQYRNLVDDQMVSSLFIGAYDDATDDAVFIIHNHPDASIIQGYVDQGLIVRTRVDEDLVFDPIRFQTALESGAQLLTTDFVPYHQINYTEDVVYLQDDYLIVKNRYLLID